MSKTFRVLMMGAAYAALAVSAAVARSEELKWNDFVPSVRSDAPPLRFDAFDVRVSASPAPLDWSGFKDPAAAKSDAELPVVQLFTIEGCPPCGPKIEAVQKRLAELGSAAPYRFEIVKDDDRGTTGFLGYPTFKIGGQWWKVGDVKQIEGIVAGAPNSDARMKAAESSDLAIARQMAGMTSERLAVQSPDNIRRHLQKEHKVPASVCNALDDASLERIHSLMTRGKTGMDSWLTAVGRHD